MPTYEVRGCWTLNHREIDGQPDEPDPWHVRDDEAMTQTRAVWPREPFVIEAASPEAAVRAAQSAQIQSGLLMLPEDSDAEVRFAELTKRIRAGAEKVYTGTASWFLRMTGETRWELFESQGIESGTVQPLPRN